MERLHSHMSHQRRSCKLHRDFCRQHNPTSFADRPQKIATCLTLYLSESQHNCWAYKSIIWIHRANSLVDLLTNLLLYWHKILVWTCKNFPILSCFLAFLVALKQVEPVSFQYNSHIFITVRNREHSAIFPQDNLAQFIGWFTQLSPFTSKTEWCTWHPMYSPYPSNRPNKKWNR